MHNGKRHTLADLDEIKTKSYLMLETISKDKEASRSVHVIMPDMIRPMFKMGRGHEADVRINDISVSRFHAQILCGKDGYILEDNGSKFGTLILEQQPIELELGKERVVQVGRTVVHLKVENPQQNGVSGVVRTEASQAEGAKAADGEPMEDIPDEGLTLLH